MSSFPFTPTPHDEDPKIGTDDVLCSAAVVVAARGLTAPIPSVTSTPSKPPHPSSSVVDSNVVKYAAVNAKYDDEYDIDDDEEKQDDDLREL